MRIEFATKHLEGRELYLMYIINRPAGPDGLDPQ